jgi:hypothetical protein
MIRLVSFRLADEVGVEIHRRARLGFFGSIHKNLSWGSSDGVYVATSGGLTESTPRSKKRI